MCNLLPQRIEADQESCFAYVSRRTTNYTNPCPLVVKLKHPSRSLPRESAPHCCTHNMTQITNKQQKCSTQQNEHNKQLIKKQQQRNKHSKKTGNIGRLQTEQMEWFFKERPRKKYACFMLNFGKAFCFPTMRFQWTLLFIFELEITNNGNNEMLYCVDLGTEMDSSRVRLGSTLCPVKIGSSILWLGISVVLKYYPTTRPYNKTTNLNY